MSTPEGATKDHIRAIIAAHKAYCFMPVQQGFGRPTLDFLGARPSDGVMFAVETKAFRKPPNDRQKKIMRDMIAGRVSVFLIDDQHGDGLRIRYESVAKFAFWLSNPGMSQRLDPTFIAAKQPVEI